MRVEHQILVVWEQMWGLPTINISNPRECTLCQDLQFWKLTYPLCLSEQREFGPSQLQAGPLPTLSLLWWVEVGESIELLLMVHSQVDTHVPHLHPAVWTLFLCDYGSREVCH